MNFQSRDSHSSSLFRSNHILKLEDKILLENILFVNKSSELISDLCNLSINSGKFPDSCKVAKLRPLYKKGSLTQLCNYRPISLLPRIPEVIEKVIHDQTSTFLNSKQLLSS